MHNSEKKCRQCPSCGTPLETWFQGEVLQELRKREGGDTPEIETVTDTQSAHKDTDSLSDEPIVFGGAAKNETIEPSPMPEIKSEPVVKSNEDKTYRPALRAFLTEWFITAICLVFWLFPEGMLSMFINNETLANLHDWPWMVEVIQWLSFLCLIYFSGKILLSWMANRFHLKANIVESSKGIVARNTASVRYNHIRSVEIVQGVIDRILDTGRIELATAGSADVEIIFSRVASPLEIKNDINARILAAGKSGD